MDVRIFARVPFSGALLGKPKGKPQKGALFFAGPSCRQDDVLKSQPATTALLVGG